MTNTASRGYHGTVEDCATQIIESQKFIHSNKDSEWLGGGIYFYSYRAHAVLWAESQVKRTIHIGKKPVVLSAELVYTEEQCLDMDDPQQREDFLDEVVHCFESSGKHISPSCPRSQPKEWYNQCHKIWCAAFELYRKLHPEIGITFYTFSPKENYLCIRNTEKQICVSDDHIVTNIRLEA